METINGRVRILRKELSMTQQEFADALKLKSGNTFSMIERGESRVTEQNILLICTPNRLKAGITVNEEWLRTGQGEIYKQILDARRINHRVIMVRKALGMTQEDFAEKADIHAGLLSAIESGNAEVTEGSIFRICWFEALRDGLTVNETWLRTGEGEMFGETFAYPVDERLEKLKAEEKELIEIFDRLYPSSQQEVVNYAWERLELQEFHIRDGRRAYEIRKQKKA